MNALKNLLTTNRRRKVNFTAIEAQITGLKHYKDKDNIW
jgi:hypothetical protein